MSQTHHVPGHPLPGASVAVLPDLGTLGMAKAPPGHGGGNWEFFWLSPLLWG